VKGLLASCLLLAAVSVLLIAAPAQAAVSCNYSAASHAVTVTMNAQGDIGSIVRNGTAILVNGVACGAATVNNTDTITVNGAVGRQNLAIDFSGGAFMPGFTPDAVSSEIEFAINLGAGSDTLTLAGGSTGETFTAGTAGLNLNSDSDVDVTLAGVEGLVLNGNGGADTLSADGGRGTGSTYPLGLNIAGGIGNDVITGGAGRDSLSGGADNDTVTGGMGADYLFGGSEADTLHGGLGNDALYPQSGNDTTYGDDGTDTIYTDSTLDGQDVFNGGPGRDTVTYYGRTTALTITIDGAANDGQAGENDNVKADVENVTGGSGDDHLTGSPENNSLDGYGGSDTLDGLAGDDVLSGGSSYVDASGADTLNGGDGNDNMSGYNGADHLNGDNGNDSLSGGPGADVVDGGEGDDSVYSDYTLDGADTYTGGIGIDFISYYGRTCNVTIIPEGSANDGCTGEHDNVMPDFESFDGGSGADTITGNAADNTIYGEGGADILNGKDGSDYLDGGDGADTMIGGDGEDALYGDAQNDSFQLHDGGYDYADGGTETDTVTNQDAGLDVVANVP
jgi:Ca2+-binding RTX toxin-like protein